MRLMFANLLLNAVYYGITVVIGPWVILALEDGVGLLRHPGTVPGVLSGFLIFFGAGLQFWCIVLFHRVGRGTPSPARPPEILVTHGPYRFVRNPINIGELLVFLGLAGWFGSVALVGYTLFAWLSFHAFIVLWEEPCLERAFGVEFVPYKALVTRWMPRWQLPAQN